MHYIVSGGSGFIGSALVKRLVKDGHMVSVLDNNSRGDSSRLESLKDKIKFFECDIRNTNEVISLTKGADSFIHLAAVNGTENFYKDPEKVLDIGVRGILSAIDVCRHNKIKELIVASSSEAYQTPSLVPTPEKVPLIVPDVMNPRYSYGGSKIISELLAINYGRKDFNRVMIFRPHNVYGPDMGWEHVLPQFILRAIRKIKQHPAGRIPFEILGNGEQTRAFIHIDDFIDGMMIMIDKGKHLGIYNIGNMEEIAIKDIALKVVEYFGHEADILVGDLAPGETLRRCPDIKKIEELGFAPKISFDQGLPSIANWYEQNSVNRLFESNPLMIKR
jgi:dTDP-glucose 4,6-dehydratase/UDP-glucose 4-epimerase